MSDRWTVLLLAAVMFTSAADLLIMTPILPQVTHDLGVAVERGGFWVTAYALATGLFALIFGPVSDRYGRRPILIIGMIVLCFGTVCCAFAWSFWTMLLARTCAGMGAGLLVTSTTSFVGDHFEARHRAIAMGFVTSGFFLALILAIPLGATLAGALGWNRMFVAYTALSGFVFLLLLFALPRPRNEQRTDHLSIGHALQTYGSLLSQRNVTGVIIMSAAVGISMTMFSVYSSPWMEQELGLDTTQRGLAYAVGGPAAIVGGPIAGRLSNRFGRVNMVIGGSILMAIMQVVVPFTAALGFVVDSWLGDAFARFGSLSWPAMLPALASFFLVMLAGSFRAAPLHTLSLEIVPSSRRGALAALRNGFHQVGAGLGAALGAFIWSASPDHAYLLVCSVAAALGIVGMIFLKLRVGTDQPLRDQ